MSWGGGEEGVVNVGIEVYVWYAMGVGHTLISCCTWN